MCSHFFLFKSTERNAIMNYYTPWTSGLFLIPAFFQRRTWMGTWFMLLTCTSSIHHTFYFTPSYPGKTWFAYADRAIAHYITFRTMYEAFHLPLCSYIFIYWISIAYIVLTYYCVILQRPGIYSPIHESIHVAAVLGTMSLCKANFLSHQ